MARHAAPDVMETVKLIYICGRGAPPVPLLFYCLRNPNQSR
jgi:hypothetical protein